MRRGIDLNLGCPQEHARSGHYGAYLLGQKDWPLVEQIGMIVFHDGVVILLLNAPSSFVDDKVSLRPNLHKITTVYADVPNVTPRI